jgi:hypothetical protein
MTEYLEQISCHHSTTEDETEHSRVYRPFDTAVKDLADDSSSMTSLREQLTGNSE